MIKQTPEAAPMRRWHSIPSAAAYTLLAERTIYRLLAAGPHRGGLTRHKLGKRVLISGEELDQLLQSCAQPPQHKSRKRRKQPGQPTA